MGLSITQNPVPPAPAGPATTPQPQAAVVPQPAAPSMRLSSADAETLCALAAMQIRYGKPHEAVPYLLAVRKHQPGHAQAIRLLAVTLMKLNRWAEAQSMLDELDRVDPRPGPLRALYRALTEFKQARLDNARAWFTRFAASKEAIHAPGA
ncbi:MAG: tetratricopeptide repeat protein [Pseudomonadota bacterium]